MSAFRFRPSLESLDERIVPDAAPIGAPGGSAAVNSGAPRTIVDVQNDIDTANATIKESNLQIQANDQAFLDYSKQANDVTKTLAEEQLATQQMIDTQKFNDELIAKIRDANNALGCLSWEKACMTATQQ